MSKNGNNAKIRLRTSGFRFKQLVMNLESMFEFKMLAHHLGIAALEIYAVLLLYLGER